MFSFFLQTFLLNSRQARGLFLNSTSIVLEGENNYLNSLADKQEKSYTKIIKRLTFDLGGNK